MLVNSKKMLQDARIGSYAIPATDIFNLETLRGVLDAAKKLDCPIIVALAEIHEATLPLEECVNMVKNYANKMTQDVVLHLDHGYDLDLIKRAIDLGFTSVMFDGSSLPFDENISSTKEIVEYAKKYDVSVEAEIGHVGAGSSGSSELKEVEGEDHSRLTTVEEAVEFANLTGVDSLAISIGTAHGNYTGVPQIDFDRLKDIKANVNVPLVLHGGSGTGVENLNKCVLMGISKVNIYTDLINAANAAYLPVINEIDYFELSAKAQQAVCDKVIGYYEVFMTKKHKERG